MRCWPRRLLWRIYLHGLLGLVVFALAAFGLFVLLREDRGPMHRLPARVAGVLPELAEGAPAAIEPRLRAMGELLQLDLALYSADGRLVAAAGASVPGPLGPEDPPLAGEAVGFGRDLRHHVAVPVAGSDRYLVIGWRKRVAGRLLLGLLGVLLFIGTLSIPLARAVARPLERLTATARALGDGDLSARTGLLRSDEIGELARAMDEMAARLERILAHERELLANISHELRTPMARIRVALALQAEEGGLGPFLEGVEDDLAELEALVADVLTSARLDLSEGEAGFAIRPVSLDVPALLDAARARFERRHPGRDLRIAVAAGLLAPRGDEALVRRVVDNLLENAARYSDAPAVIELAVERDPAGLAVSVADRGVGLAEADLPRLFEPFFRADRSRARATGGVGLGLTLCRRIVEAHGGRIEGRARTGGGAVFRFTLPVVDGGA